MSESSNEVGSEKENEFYIYYSNIIKYYARRILEKLKIKSKLYYEYRPYDLKKRLESSDTLSIQEIHDKEIGIDALIYFILSDYLLKKGVPKSHIERLISEIELDSNTINNISLSTESSKNRQRMKKDIK